VHGQEKVENAYFSIKVPDTWTYQEISNTAMADLLGRGPGNSIFLTPGEFGNLLVEPKEGERSVIEKIQQDGGVLSGFLQDTTYTIKNSPLDAYLKYRIGQEGGNWNVTSMDNGTIAKEKAVKISLNGTNESGNLRKVYYLLLHDKGPYALSYMANSKDFDKYLPEFEQMVRSFKFVN
jgi:hypothetical protein